MLSMDLGFRLAHGRPWIGFTTLQCSTLIAQVEIPEYQMRERVKKYVEHDPDPLMDAQVHFLSHPYLRIDQVSGYGMIQKAITAIQPKVLILDPFYRLFSGDITDNHAVQGALDKMDHLAHLNPEMALILIGHTRKPKDPNLPVVDWGNELIGGSYIMDWVDTGIALERVLDDEILMHFIKVRHSTEELPDIRVNVDRSTLHFKRSLL